MKNYFEDQETDFKRNIDSRDWHSWLKTCCALQCIVRSV